MNNLVKAVKQPFIKLSDEYVLTIENRYLDVAKYNVTDFKRYLKNAANIKERHVECKYIFFTREKQYLIFIVLLRPVKSHKNVIVKGCFIKSEAFIEKVVDLDEDVSNVDLDEIIIPYFSYGGTTFYKSGMGDVGKLVPTYQFDRVVFSGKYDKYNNPYMNCYDNLMEEGMKNICVVVIR